MRNVAIAAVVGAVFGALVALLVAPRPTQGSEPSEVAVALTEVRDAVALLRRSIDARPSLGVALADAPRAPAPAPAPAGPSESRLAPPDPDERAVPPTRDGPGAPPRASEIAALRDLRAFEFETGTTATAVEARKTGGVRARWLFATEREVLSAFGVPDEVQVNDNSENWTYRIPVEDEEEEDDDVVLVFSRGRLVQVWE